MRGWRVEAGGKSYADTMLIQRPGNLAGALGGLTIPVLPVSIVYAPPVELSSRECRELHRRPDHRQFSDA